MTSQSHRRTAADALVEGLSDHGVDTVFGIPGTHNLPIYEALSRHGIQHVLMRHEQGCAYAADGYARSSGRIAAVLTTTGPGLLNAATGLAQANSDSVPVLAVSPGVPVGHPGAGVGLLHEMRSQQTTMDGILAHHQRVERPDDVSAVVAQAFHAMTAGRPQPAFVEVAYDILDEPTAASAAPIPRPDQLPNSLPAVEIAQATSLLQAAQRPLIVAGGGVRGAAVEHLRAVAELLNAPVITTFNGKGALDENHDMSLGAGLGRAGISELAEASDLILAVGTELAPSDLWAGPLPQRPLIRVDIDPHRLLTNAAATVAIHADVTPALAGLVRSLTEAADEAGASRPAVWHEKWATRLRHDSDDRAGRWRQIIDALQSTIGTDGILASDSTMACYYGAAPSLRLTRDHSLLYPSGFGTLGYGLPAAVGAKLANPDRAVACLQGDGGIMFTIAELASAAALGLALPVVLVRNGGYGEIRRQMVERGQPALGVDIDAPDFELVARGLGCLGTTATDGAELESAIKVALEADRPTVICVDEQPAARS